MADLNQFQLLYNAHRGSSGALRTENQPGISRRGLDDNWGVLRETIVGHYTTDILADAVMCKGYVLRANEEVISNIENIVFDSTPFDKGARCMIMPPEMHTELLDFPNSYDQTEEDESLIDAFPQFRYNSSDAGEITIGSYLKVAFYPGDLSSGIVISRYDMDPEILASVDISKAATNFEDGEPTFLYEMAIDSPPRATTALNPKNAGFYGKTGEWQCSPNSTYAIPEDYFDPSAYKKQLAKAVSSLDDAVKPRFARAIKKFLTQYYDLGYDITITATGAFRSNGESDYLWELEHVGVMQPDGTIKKVPTGAVKGGQSWHNYGCAVDTLVWVKGHSHPKTGRQNRHKDHDLGWWEEEGPAPASVYHTKLRNAMLQERLYNPIDGTQINMPKKDPGHFMPIEISTGRPPAALKSGKVKLASLVQDPGAPVKV